MDLPQLITFCITYWFVRFQLVQGFIPSLSISTSTKTSQTQSPPDVLRTMYPLPHLLKNGTIQLDNIHKMYYEEYGPPPAKKNDHDN